MVGKTVMKLVIKPIGVTGFMVAECPECKKKICETKYADMGDGDAKHKYNLKKDKWTSNIKECPFCGVQFHRKKTVEKRLRWAKAGKHAMAANAKNGEFTITKFGRGYLWTFRYYGENFTRAENQGSAMCREVAERACEKHKEWKV